MPIYSSTVINHFVIYTRGCLWQVTHNYYNFYLFYSQWGNTSYVAYEVRFKVQVMDVSDWYSESSQSVDEALSGRQWDIHWSLSSGGALGSTQRPDGGYL